MTSKKQSQITTVQDFVNGDTVTGVRGAANVNFTYSGLVDALSGLGSFNQAGDVTGTPILEQPGGGVNNIRNLEPGKGIITSVSPENGASVECNFTQTGGGEAIITDLNEDIYNFKTLVAGTNMALSSDDESITISFNPDVASTKTVAVTTVDDFPEPVGGVITLEPDMDYLILDDISTSNRFVTNGNNTLRAASSQIIKLTYTGSDIMLTGNSSNFKYQGITVSAPTGTLLDFSAPSPSGIFQMIECNVEECDSIGTLNNMLIVRFSAVGWEDIKTNGMLFDGVVLNASLDTGYIALNGGTFLDLGTSLINELSADTQVIQPTSDASATFLSGAANSANILSGGLGVFVGNRCNPLTTPLDTIGVDDNRYEFSGNSNIADSMNDAMMSVENSVTETVIGSAGVKVKVNNVWTEENSARFSFDSNGRFTYTGERSARLPIDISGTLLMASGGDKECQFCLAVNGVEVSQTCTQDTVSAAKASSFSVHWQHDFNTGDYVEVFVSNEDDTTNIINQQAVLRIN